MFYIVTTNNTNVFYDKFLDLLDMKEFLCKCTIINQKNNLKSVKNIQITQYNKKLMFKMDSKKILIIHNNKIIFNKLPHHKEIFNLLIKIHKLKYQDFVALCSSVSSQKDQLSLKYKNYDIRISIKNEKINNITCKYNDYQYIFHDLEYFESAKHQQIQQYMKILFRFLSQQIYNELRIEFLGYKSTLNNKIQYFPRYQCIISQFIPTIPQVNLEIINLYSLKIETIQLSREYDSNLITNPDIRLLVHILSYILDQNLNLKNLYTIFKPINVSRNTLTCKINNDTIEFIFENERLKEIITHSNL